MRLLVSVTAALAIASILGTLSADEAINRRKAAHVPRMSFLENKHVKIGLDLNLGGAITYLSPSGRDDNLVNNWDWGRQIQMSHYSGPSPFRVAGKEPATAWAHFGWNPVQAGDHFGFASKTIESSNNGQMIRVTSRPMQWSLPDVPCECTFESEVRLDGPLVLVRNRVISERSDMTRYGPYPQELPAIYVNGPYYRLMSYTGDRPFTGGDLKRIEKTGKDKFPWARFRATEHWAAQVNDAGFGLGAYQPVCINFLGGFAGKPGKGGTKDSPTGYIAPVRDETIDPRGTYEYEYVLTIGSLAEIRDRFVRRHGPARLPAFDFARDRQGWVARGARDRGIVDGAWSVPLRERVELHGPPGIWQASDASIVEIDAAIKSDARTATIYWATHEDPRFVPERRLTGMIMADGTMQKHRIDLSKSPEYRGAIAQLRIDFGMGESATIKSIRLTK